MAHVRKRRAASAGSTAIAVSGRACSRIDWLCNPDDPFEMVPSRRPETAIPLPVALPYHGQARASLAAYGQIHGRAYSPRRTGTAGPRAGAALRNLMAIPFERNFNAPFGDCIEVSPLIHRVLAPDPGPDMPEHLAALKRALEGKRVTHILVTHTHSDHSPAARPLKEWTGAKTYAFGPHGSGKADEGVRVEEGGDMAFVPDVRVRDGDVIEGSGISFDCVFTPGHTSNHMCFALREEKALFTGDHVMGWSTTVVTPPDGDMRSYMASLRKLLARDDETLYPTHGAPVRDPKPFVQAYIGHRLEREA